MRAIIAVITSVAVLTSPAWASSPGSAAPPVTNDARVGDRAAAAAYQITPGVVFNNPRRRDQAGRVIGKMRRAIQHVPKGYRIQIMTWNFQHAGIRKDLINAHQRGVGVRLIMARSLARKQGYRGDFHRLTRALKKGDSNRPGFLTSFTRTCSNSCRGRGGSMHNKFMLISKSGTSRHIVQQGSANFTGSAAGKQWNDWYSLPNNKTVWNAWRRVFNQALRDRPYDRYQMTWRHIYSWFAPRSMRKDPVMPLLNDVRCYGARNAGVNGRTAIRVASAVFQDYRGLRIARKLKSLKRNGCNVRVVFTMMSNNIRDAIRGVPTRQLVYDWNGDGAFDRYLHMKAFTISGNFRGDRSHRLVFNGSANWSTMGMISDEHGMVIHSDSREKQYASWINGLYNSAPRGLRPTPEYYESRGLENPYEDLELELAGQG